MFKVLVVEDDKNANRLMSAVLRTEGYEVISAFDGLEALEKMEVHQVDLIVLDLMMPHMDGLELTDLLRSTHHNLPILMVTAKDQMEDIHKGFLVGTDDYMVKPVNQKELLLRIKALFRRSKIAADHKIVIGKVTLDYDSLTVFREKEKVILPPKEFYLLYKLLSYPDKIFTRLQLLDEIWGLDSESMESTVTVHVNRLRTKFLDFEEFELVAIRGVGYKAVKKV